ncbi:MAG: 4Fe-4S dicluster domain-containing protein [Bacteroidetes bacterium]|nr:4Fe-4S dicluster domain-containing protein [Bacteroidota bacterium]
MGIERILFIAFTALAFGFFFYTIYKLVKQFKFTRSKSIKGDVLERTIITLKVAFGQTKMFKRPVAGILHALVWWGFLVITVGTLEMIIDGLAGTTRFLQFSGKAYAIVTASGEIFGVLVILASFLFLFRRYIIKPKRFTGKEMKPSARLDATAILSMIILLMVSLLGMNQGYLMLHPETYVGYFPIGSLFVNDAGEHLFISNGHLMEKANWWIHIVLVLFFLNYLPYSKHFHVILAVPNVFFTRLEPYAKMDTMESITREIKLMTNPEPVPEGGVVETAPPRFGVKDVEDVSWKTLMDANTCTECGRCTEVCPANITGKQLSPRKLFIDLRARSKDKMPGLIEEGMSFSDNKSLVGDYITTEELWACTACMACIEECPVNIDHVPFIMDMRRNLVMEESSAPPELNNMFSNIENNGAPWQFSASDRMKWTEGMDIPTMAEMVSRGETPEILFWVGCAGAFDDRYKSVTRSFAAILKEAGIKFAVLGTEESCTGDPAKRAGNEYLYQMQAMQNIELLNKYDVKKVVTACPHCFNVMKNEYPDLGGNYEVIHHSVLLEELMAEGKIGIKEDNPLKKTKITYHDSCYIGRGNGIYEAPRNVLKGLQVELKEMEKNRHKGMCCGAGGAQMFKEEEKGHTQVNIKRTEEALETGAEIVASACPFCMTMMTDGVKHHNKEAEMKVLDLAELVAEANGLDR